MRNAFVEFGYGPVKFPSTCVCECVLVTMWYFRGEDVQVFPPLIGRELRNVILAGMFTQ